MPSIAPGVPQPTFSAPVPQLVLVGRVPPFFAPAEHAELAATFELAVAIESGVVAFVGPAARLPARFHGTVPVAVPLITPGLVDAHTHAAWLGSRHGEYIAKIRGEPYEQIAARGGGIVASMRAIDDGSVDEIAATLIARLRRMAAAGVTTVEVKSGYGLRPELERRQLEAIAIARARDDVPRVVPTYLALHALPPECTSAPTRAAFVAEAARNVATFAAEGLCAFVDAYVDRNAFTVNEARAVGRAARDAGVGVRMHVGQFADIGGAELAAELGASSVDHLENVGPRALESLAAAGVSAVLLPVASFVLRQAPPDVAALRAAGIPLVVATDANPGTAPTESLPLAVALGVRDYGLSVEEALLGATRNAARTLRRAGEGGPSASRTGAGGILEVGAPADVVGWDVPHEEALVQPWGVPLARIVLRGGRAIAGPGGVARG